MAGKASLRGTDDELSDCQPEKEPGGRPSAGCGGRNHGGTRSYAEAKGGRFLIFGSVAKGRMTNQSDIDVLIDFPPETEPEAWQFVEQACRRHGLSGDIYSVSTTKREFIDRVSSGAVVLP